MSFSVDSPCPVCGLHCDHSSVDCRLIQELRHDRDRALTELEEHRETRREVRDVLKCLLDPYSTGDDYAKASRRGYELLLRVRGKL